VNGTAIVHDLKSINRGDGTVVEVIVAIGGIEA
jgi:hypothetical protein